jgi:hypothetical protein
MPRPRFATYAIVIRLLTMSIVWLSLLVWFLNAYRTSCGVALAVWGVLGIILLGAGTERAYFHRRALFNECVLRKGRLFPIFHNRILILLREAAYAALLALILLVSALVLEVRQWSLMIADILLMGLLIPRLSKALEAEMRDAHRFAVARQWAMWISVLLLWADAVMVLTMSPREDFVGMRWQEVVTYGVTVPDVQCALIGAVARIYVVGQALAIWAAQNASRVMHDPTQSVMVWVGFVTLFGFTFLAALAFSRALVGVLSRPWTMWRSVPGTRERSRDVSNTSPVALPKSPDEEPSGDVG